MNTLTSDTDLQSKTASTTYMHKHRHNTMTTQGTQRRGTRAGTKRALTIILKPKPKNKKTRMTPKHKKIIIKTKTTESTDSGP